MATNGAALAGLGAFLAAEEDGLQFYTGAFVESPPSDNAPHRPKTRNRSRDKRQVEIEYLRQRARELEFQLQAMKAAEGEDVASLGVTTNSGPQVRALFDLSWRSIAHRQLGKRQRSEAENRRLKKSVTENVLAARRLQRLLLQTSTTANQQQDDVMVTTGVSPWTANDLELVQRFAREVEVEYSRVDTILQNHGLGGYTLTPDHDVGVACVKAVPFNTGPDVLYLDLQSTSMIPFPFRRVCDVAWKAVQTLFEHGTRCPVNDGMGDSRVAVKLPSSFSCNDAVRYEDTDCLLVMQRYVEKKRMVLVWRTTCDDARQSESMVTDETGWCVFEPIEPLAGASHMSGTLVRGCVHVIPIAKETRVPQEPEEVSALTRKLVEGLKGDLKALKGIIEDSLLSEAMQYDKKTAET